MFLGPISDKTTMENFEEIKTALRDDDSDECAALAGDRRRITITSSDPMMNMQNQIVALISENTDLKTRVSTLEAKVNSLIFNTPASVDRSRVKLPSTDLFTMTPTPMNAHIDEDSDAVMNGSRTRTPSSSRGRPPSEVPNPFADSSRFTAASSTTFKSNSAVAPQGYVGKKSVWGTAMASMLVAASRYYISKTGSDMMMIDELRLMKNCTIIVPVFYFAALHRDLPDVKHPCTRYLSNAISRMDKNEVPISDAETWVYMKKYQDGKDVGTVLDTVVRMMKRIPEVVTHPVSQIVSMLLPPVTRTVNEKAIFAVASGMDVSLSPTQWESWCSILKEQALVKYIKYRLSGMSETQVVAKMVSEMRPSDLTEKKNLNMIDTIAPFTMRHQSASER